MTGLLSLVSTWSLVDLALKSAAVMLLALVVAMLLGRASAAWRHLIWCLSATSLLLLPVLALALSAWRVTWLPQWAAEPTRLAETAPLAGTGEIAQAPADRIAAPGAVAPDAGPSTATVLPPFAARSTEAAEASLPAAIETTSTRRGPLLWLPIAWAVGALSSLVPLGAGLWQLAALHRRSRVIDDPRWLALLGELRRQLALCRNVQIRRSVGGLVPLTWGTLTPTLLVPAEAHAWPDERRRLVLLHELAHVRRWDWLTQLLAQVACAAYWFNPLVWLAARQMQIERERACDDLVLASGASASAYARELVALAAGLSKSQLSTLVAVPMARRGALESRLRGILDNRRPRTAPTSRAICLGVALAAAAMAPLAVLRAGPPESTRSETNEPMKVAPPVKEQPAEKPADESAAAAAPQRNPLLGKEAAERVGKFRPSFSKALEGVEVGISLTSDRKAFHEGERVPLEFVIRNVSETTLLVVHSLFPAETPPIVIGGDGMQLTIQEIHRSGAKRLYQDVLKPNEAAVYRHPGLGLGEKPNPPGTFWHPFLKNAAKGKYRLSQPVHVTVREEGQDSGGTSFDAVTGEVEFGIEPPEGVKKAEKPPENAVEKNGDASASRTVTIRGKVVDVDTGEPITQFMIRQAGKYDPLDPGKVNWVPKEDGPSAGDGSFSTTVQWTEGWTVRVAAAGYFPKGLLTSPPPGDQEEMEMTIRLERVPEKVRGVVRDHAGKPVHGAAVFAVGPTGLNLAAGQAWSPAWPGDKKDDAARPVLTDEKGRFELATGGATTVAVSHARFDAWSALISPSGGMTVRLPEPARVEVEMNINGAEKEAAIFYQLLPELDGVVRSSRTLTIANPGRLVLDALPPGKYQLCRYASTGAMLERQLFALKAGERKSIDYVREKGARVRGKVTWPADATPTGIALRILNEKSGTVASTSPAEDGTFLTERVAPGTYGLVVYAYKPLTPEQMRTTGAIAPSYEAQTMIEVPDDGEVIVKDLILKPIQRGK
jgi:beta-lactamase regulating signal transducer with metallopeptidase domain